MKWERKKPKILLPSYIHFFWRNTLLLRQALHNRKAELCYFAQIFCKNILPQRILYSVVQMVVNGLFELQTLRMNFCLFLSFGKKWSLPHHHTEVLCINVGNMRLLYNIIYKAWKWVFFPYITTGQSYRIHIDLSNEILEVKESCKSYRFTVWNTAREIANNEAWKVKCCRTMKRPA